ncbi:MAG: lipid-A-disaccharide synthase [Cycloclasticus sp.]|nr:lipid-A-disaccharide synthase [Cycloclasticus sp.]
MSTANNTPIKIMMVAGEHSGDILGAGLINQLKQLYPHATFSGIGGQRMIQEGFESFHPMSKLSVFGLFEVIKHLPELLGIRKNLKQLILAENPDVFIGIDAPDFNLKLERQLHQRGIKTVHYVSPTVWAWRPKRIKKLIGSLNALLCIFPFEETYFKETPVPAFFIGHPLADQYKNAPNQLSSRKSLGIDAETTVITMMPGSRVGELNRHSLEFLKAISICADAIPNLKVLVPMPDKIVAEQFNNTYQQSDIQLDIDVKEMATNMMISASNMVLVASGTATLEVMLMKKPMVVAYQLSPLTTWVFRTFNLFKAAFVSMPNLIAGKELVKELLHENMNAELMAEQLLRLYTEPTLAQAMVDEFDKMNTTLTRNADVQAAKIVERVINNELAT